MPKEVHMPDGQIIHFPDDMDDATIHAEGLKYLQKVMAPPPPPDQRALNAQQVKPIGPTGTPSDYLVHPKANFATDALIENVLRPILPKAGAVAAASVSGPAAVPAGIAAYGGIDALLQHLRSKPEEQSLLSGALGTNPGSASSTVLNSLEQAAILGAGEKILGGTWKAIKAFRAADQPEILKFIPTASQALKAEGKMPTTSGILKFIEDHFSPGSKSRAQDMSGLEGAKIGNKLAAKTAGRSVSTVNNPNDMAALIGEELVPEKVVKGTTNVIRPYAKNPEELDKLIADPVRLQDALTRSQNSGAGINAKQDLAGYRLARIQQAATTTAADGSTRIDANKAAALFNDPEMQASNTKLFGSQAQSNIKQFYKNLSFTQDKMGSSGAFNRVIMYSDGIGLPMALMHSAVSGNLIGAVTAGGAVALQLGMVGLAKALTKPGTARLMLALANNEALGVSDQYAARAITQAISNTGAYLVNQDGSKTPVRVGKDGKLEPVEEGQ